MSTPGPVLAQDSSADQLVAVAGIAHLRGAWRNAETLYAQAAKADPDSAAAHRGLGFVLAEQGRTAEAVAAYRLAVRLEPRHARTLYNLAAVVDAGNPRQALSLWGQYVAVAKGDPAETTYRARAQARIRQLTGLR